jgi:hypothetical protein
MNSRRKTAMALLIIEPTNPNRTAALSRRLFYSAGCGNRALSTSSARDAKLLAYSDLNEYPRRIQ